MCIEWVVDIVMAVPFHKPVVLLAREPGRNKREKPEGEEPRGRGWTEGRSVKGRTERVRHSRAGEKQKQRFSARNTGAKDYKIVLIGVIGPENNSAM